jgi:hypothetical protein
LALGRFVLVVLARERVLEVGDEAVEGLVELV